MTAATHTPTVLLALDRQPQPWTVATAFTLARHLHARLEGLFIEELNLLRLSALPFSQEIAALSAQCRPLATSTLEQALRSQAQQLQQLLATQAELAQIEWRFSVVRDHLMRAVSSAAAEADLFIMQGVSRHGATRRNIAALYDGTAGVVETAAHLAAGSTLHVLLTSPHDSARPAITARLRPLGVQPLFITLADDRVATLRAVALHRHLTTLVLPAALLYQNQQQLQPLIEELACTVVVMPSEYVDVMNKAPGIRTVE